MEIKSDEVYTLKETRDLLKVSSSTLGRLIKKGMIRAAKVGKQYRITGKELLRVVSPEPELSLQEARHRPLADDEIQ